MPQHVFKGHNKDVWCVAISGDCKRIASAGDDSTIIVWDALTRQHICTLQGHKSTVWGVAVSPCGKLLVSAGNEHDMFLWNLEGPGETPMAPTTLAGHTGVVNSVKFSLDGKRIVSASDDGKVIIWDVQSSKKLLTFDGHEGAAYCAVWAPDGMTVVSGGEDKALHVHDYYEGANPRKLSVSELLRGHSATIITLCFGQINGLNVLVSGSWDGVIMIWSRPDGFRDSKTTLILTLQAHTGDLNVSR
jgi:WD40 repeat protein